MPHSPGKCAASKKNIEFTITHFQRAAALAPKEARAYYGLGIANELLKQDAQATSEFENALSRNPNMVEAVWHDRDDGLEA